MNRYRGTGITSRQMMNSPNGATYVWCNGDLRYPTLLARHLGRTDLKIIGPGSVKHLEGARRYIVTDHACMLSWQHRQLIGAINFMAEKEAAK